MMKYMIFLILIYNVFSIVATSNPPLIKFNDTNLHPEGVEWDEAGHRFFLTSLTLGRITQVFDNGTFSTFIPNNGELQATIGCHIDKIRNKLIFCNNNLAFLFGLPYIPFSEVRVYNLPNGDLNMSVELTNVVGTGPTFCNDVTTDLEGNIYSTETIKNFVYKITPSGDVSLFSNSSLFPQLGGQLFGINGIEYDPINNILIVGKSDEPAYSLMRIPLDDPFDVSIIPIDQVLFDADGLIFHPSGALIVVDNNVSRVVSLKSDDGWNSAKVIAIKNSIFDFPSTAAIRDNDVYVTFIHNVELFNLTLDRDQFEIERIDGLFPCPFTMCEGGKCYYLLKSRLRESQARNRCTLVAATTSNKEALSSLLQHGPAWINSFNGNDFGNDCVAMLPNGRIIHRRHICNARFQALCEVPRPVECFSV